MTTLITPLPTPPTRQDSANFNDRADDFLGSLPLFQQEANDLAVDVQSSADEVEIARQAVVSVANVTKWVSGNTYSEGSSVWSPVNGVAYRKVTTSIGGVTDPSIDTTNYKSITDAAGFTYMPAGTGAVVTTVQEALRDNMVSVKRFGAVGNGVVDDAAAIQNAINYCVTNKRFLDLTGASTGWKIRSRLSFTGIPGIMCSYSSPIIVDVTGTYTNQYAVEFGDPSAGWNSGRSAACTIIGHLYVAASSRSAALNGIYMKGSWFNADHVMAYGFNGCGILQDSVWDSTFTRLYTELCGNITTYALRLDSNGDTHNTSHIVSLQCEQAYHKGMYIKTLRSVIDNIHAERLAVLTTNDGTTTYGYLNHYIELSNSQINQAIIDCLTVGTAPDGSSLASTVINVKIVGNESKISSAQIPHSKVIHDYGTAFTFDVLSVTNFVQCSPAAYTIVNGAFITADADIENAITLNSCSIGQLKPSFNALDITVNHGAVAVLTFASNILGNIQFNDVVLQTIGDTKAPSATRNPVTFNNCNINQFNGAYNSVARVVGGYVGTCSLVSQSRAEFNNVIFGTFSYTGNTGFLTRNCFGPAASTWSVPLNVSYPAGTVTERVGYNVDGKIYQNTDGGVTWSKLV